MAMTGILVKYGDLELKPAPLINYSLETFKDGAKENVLGTLHRYTLDGTILATDIAGSGTLQLFNEKDRLVSGFQKDYQDFEITLSGTAGCSGTVVCGRPLVESFSIDSDNNFTTFLKYNAELLFAHTSVSDGVDFPLSIQGLESASTEFSQEETNAAYSYGSERAAPIVTITRNASAKGIKAPSSGGTCDPYQNTALHNAVAYVTSVGAVAAPPPIATKGFYSIDAGNSLFYVTKRVVSTNASEGTASATDTIIAIPTGGPGVENVSASGRPENFAVYDSFSVDAASELANGLGTITVQGNLQGWTSYSQQASGQGGLDPSGMLQMSTGSDIPEPYYSGTTAFDNLSGYMVSACKNELFYNRANTLYQGGNISTGIHLKSILPLKKDPITTTLSYNIAEGTASYSFTYDNRPDKLNPGALSESVNLSKARQIPVHAAVSVLGRSAGPILQDIGTKTAFTQDLNIEATFVPMASGADGAVDESGSVASGGLWMAFTNAGAGSAASGMVDETYNSIADAFENSITGVGSYFKTQDSETYDVTAGRYTRSISYIYVPCN